MTAVALALAIGLLSALGLIAWLVRGRVLAADQVADARVAQVATEGEVERATFELEVTRKALQAATIRAGALEGELSHALDRTNPAEGLDPGDVAGRVRRLAERWRHAAEARSPLPAEPTEAVPVVSAADGASSAGVPSGAIIDVLR